MHLKKIIMMFGFCMMANSQTLWAQEAAPETSLPQAFDHLLNDVEARGFVGIVGVSDADGTFYLRGLGDAVAGKHAYTADTVVDIASITKQFTGAAILTLVEQGKLRLADQLGDIFSKVPDDKKPITIHQLLTHTAGLPSVVGKDEEPLTRSAYLARAFDTPLLFLPGTRYEYSNVGYSILAAIVETVSQQSYETYLYNTLWQPAGMEATGYYRPHWREGSTARLSTPYQGLASGKDLLDHTNGNAWHLFGNGGVLSTVTDMLKWHRALQDNRLLSANSRVLLMTPHVPEHEDRIYFYGYGWSIIPDFLGKKVVWHNGGSYFSRAEFWRLPEYGIGVFVATHDQNVDPAPIAEGIVADLIRQKQHQ